MEHIGVRLAPTLTLSYLFPSLLATVHNHSDREGQSRREGEGQEGTCARGGALAAGGGETDSGDGEIDSESCKGRDWGCPSVGSMAGDDEEEGGRGGNESGREGRDSYI